MNNRLESMIHVQFATFFGTYTKAFNKCYQRTGKLFEGRFQRKLIENDRQLFRTLIYIHKNPQKHGYIADFREWPYSSLTNYILGDPGEYLSDKIIRDEGLQMSLMNWHCENSEFDDILDN